MCTGVPLYGYRRSILKELIYLVTQDSTNKIIHVSHHLEHENINGKHSFLEFIYIQYIANVIAMNCL